MYANGEGVPHSDSEAAQWYRLAADQGQVARSSTLQFADRRQGRAAGPGAGAHVAGPRRLRTSAFGEEQRNTPVDALHLVASKMSLAQLARRGS